MIVFFSAFILLVPLILVALLLLPVQEKWRRPALMSIALFVLLILVWHGVLLWVQLKKQTIVSMTQVADVSNLEIFDTPAQRFAVLFWGNTWLVVIYLAVILSLTFFATKRRFASKVQNTTNGS